MRNLKEFFQKKKSIIDGHDTQFLEITKKKKNQKEPTYRMKSIYKTGEKNEQQTRKFIHIFVKGFTSQKNIP